MGPVTFWQPRKSKGTLRSTCLVVRRSLALNQLDLILKSSSMGEGLMPGQILRLTDVLTLTGLGRSTIYSHIAAELWPKPVSLGARAVGWPALEVDALISARIAGHTDDQIRELVTQLEAERASRANTPWSPARKLV